MQVFNVYKELHDFYNFEYIKYYVKNFISQHIVKLDLGFESL